MPDYRVLNAGDTAIVVEFGESIDRRLSTWVLALARRLNEARLDGLVETVPTFRSLLVHYDPLILPTASLAGRIAEEIKFGDVTTGASNDFEQATALARRMVTQYGMSDILGPIQYGRGNHQVFLGRDFGEDRNYSEEIAGKIDAEVRRIIDDCYEDAKKILEVNWDKVERMANSLLEHETVETEEVLAILGNKPWPPNVPAVEAPPAEPPVPAPAVPDARPERPKRLPPTISPEPA